MKPICIKNMWMRRIYEIFRLTYWKIMMNNRYSVTYSGWHIYRFKYLMNTLNRVRWKINENRQKSSQRMQKFIHDENWNFTPKYHFFYYWFDWRCIKMAAFWWDVAYHIYIAIHIHNNQNIHSGYLFRIRWKQYQEQATGN